MMMILSPFGVIKSAGFESDFHYYDVTDLLFTVIPYFSHDSLLDFTFCLRSKFVTFVRRSERRVPEVQRVYKHKIRNVIVMIV